MKRSSETPIEQHDEWRYDKPVDHLSFEYLGRPDIVIPNQREE
jgi:hypothetical protein